MPRFDPVIAGFATLQLLLDDWQHTHLKVVRIYKQLNEAMEGKRPVPIHIVDFEENRCAAPSPRVYQWADGCWSGDTSDDGHAC